MVMSITAKSFGASTVPSQVPSASSTSQVCGRSCSLRPRYSSSQTAPDGSVRMSA